MVRRLKFWICLGALGSMVAGAVATQAQTANTAAPATEAVQVTIKRNAVHLLNPDDFRVPISLKATRSAQLRARIEGVLQNVRVQPGSKVSAQEELIRIESTQAAKKLERAQAALKAATLRRDLAKAESSGGKTPQISLDLAEAELKVAQADVDLAKLELDSASVRAPFAGEVVSVHVVQGENVTAGNLLIELRDAQELTVQIPVERSSVKAGDEFTVQLDSTTATGKVQSLLPLNTEWEPLRQIIDSAMLAVIVIDNKSGNYSAGQTAYSPIVPREPILEVPNPALKNSSGGSRLVQVLRDRMIRDIEVKLLGPVGEGRSYVTGPFQASDELIVGSSQVLADGAVVEPIQGIPVEAKPARDNQSRPNQNPNRNNTVNPGF